MTSASNRVGLAHQLLQQLTAGRLGAAEVLPAVAALLGSSEQPPSRAALREALSREGLPELTPLLQHLQGGEVRDAQTFYSLRKAGQAIPPALRDELAQLPLDLPLDWPRRENLDTRLTEAVDVLRDWLLVHPLQARAPRIAALVEEAYGRARARLAEPSSPWPSPRPLVLANDLLGRLGPGEGLRGALEALIARLAEDERMQRQTATGAIARWPEPLPSDLDPEAVLEAAWSRFHQSQDGAERLRLLDLALSWPTQRMASLVLGMTSEPWAQERAALVLTLRFGKVYGQDWTLWARWLEEQQAAFEKDRQARLASDSGILLLLWQGSTGHQDAGLEQGLLAWCQARLTPVNPPRFVERWRAYLSREEAEAVLGRPGGPSPLAPTVVPAATQAPVALSPSPSRSPAAEVPTALPPAREPARQAPSPRPPRPAPAAPPPVDEPSLWQEQVRGFLADNWFMVAGVLMMVVGASLLAYFTWDKHWLLRYTLMPALLAGFTAALAAAADWLEARVEDMRGTGAVLRGAAVGLLPVNFMAVGLLASDPQVTRKLVAVPVMAALYVGLFGLGLRRWCGAVHPRLGTLLGGGLLLLNGLVLLPPLAKALLPVSDDALALVLTAGFHLGFLVLAAVVWRFVSQVLDRRLAAERCVPWFLMGALAVTFTEVFVWVHGSMRYLPPAYTYAALVVLSGGLILFVERRFLALGEGTGHLPESFLGFAVILLGVLMGASDPYVRIGTFLLAGFVWLRQALHRREALHPFIGMALALLGGASIGLLDAFPRPWLPALGIGLALSLALVARLVRGEAGLRLRAACEALQLAVLSLTAVVAVLAQWHYRSWPPATALALGIMAGLFALRAGAEASPRLALTTMTLLALTLPYLGFADMEGQTLRGNTMVFGLALLSFLWIGLVGLRPSKVLLAARSTVLWLYGVFALAGMALRVVVERGAPLDPHWARLTQDAAGPLLMAVALAFAAYYSRSLVPTLLGAGILVVLFPEMRASFQVMFPQLAWGTGYGSAWSALLLLLLAFRLREVAALRELGEGDRFLGDEPFPLRRLDHSLFTIPLLASALFLTAKVDTWNLLRHLDAVPLKTAAALLVTAVSWTLFAVYGRRRALAQAGVHLGWIFLLLGFFFGTDALMEHPRLQWPLLATGLVLQAAEVLYRLWVVPRHGWAEDLLAAPTRGVLRYGSLLLAFGSMVALLQGARLTSLHALAAFVALQLIRHGLVRRGILEGANLFLLSYLILLAATAPGSGPLVDRLSLARSLTPTLAVILGVQLAHLLVEWQRDLYDRLWSLLLPAQVGVTLLAAGLAFFALTDAFAGPSLTLAQVALLLAAILLTARTHGSGAFGLLAVFLGYALILYQRLGAAGGYQARVGLLLDPWQLAALSLALALLGHLGRLLAEESPSWLRGPFAFRLLGGPALPWLHTPAVALAAFAALRQTVLADLRHQAIELPTSYLATLTHVVVGWSAGLPFLFGSAAALLGLGNIHLVRFFFGTYLRDHGLSEIHLLALGIAFTLLQGTLLKLVARRDRVASFVNRASLVGATLVLTLLSVHYLTDSNLQDIAPLRFVLSGAMALAAGLYFRRAARQPGPGEECLADVSEGLYHFGVSMAVWCTALLVPWLRQPATALLALGLPALYFYARAEIDRGRWVGRRYRNSAAVLGFLLLALYAVRPVFQMILFPEAAISTDHYHVNSALVMFLGLLLLRLHGLGGTEWLAFYGGLALIAGSYFGLTSWPGLSPFEAPVPAAWCGVLLTHFWTVASAARSPLRSLVQELAALDDDAWTQLRRSWGRLGLLASQGLVLLGILDYTRDSYAVAPLLLGAASVLIHQAIPLESRLYFALAAGEIALALHADFFVASYLPKDQVVWVLLLIWAGFLLARRAWSKAVGARLMGVAAPLLALIVMGHVLYHHPSSNTGLWTFALLAVFAALTPRESSRAAAPEEHLAAFLLLLAPTWLVYFGQAPLLSEGAMGALRTWPILASLATLFATGVGARLHQPVWAGSQPQPAVPRLWHQTLSLMGAHGSTLHSVSLGATFLAGALLQAAHYVEPFDRGSLAVFLALYAGFAVAWFFEGRLRRSSLAYLLAEASVVLGFVLARRQLMLTTDFWSYEYDVWVSLAVSFLLAGVKQAFDDEPREMKLPVVGSILVLPVFAILWTLFRHLGSDVALVVVGLHSLMFAYLGRERRDSPYNLAALFGFVSFVLIVFWSKLELRTLHAYVIPVGLGVLVLLQLFGGDLPAASKNRTRLLTLLSMLGSAGYYALLDDRYPVAFNLTLLLLCLAAMGLGSFLRVRLFPALGFAGVVVDLLSLAVKVVAHMDRGERMTSIGIFVLLIGAALVSGAVYQKAHRDEMESWLDSWRHRLAEWE
jgi:hypothetical protein